MKFVQLLFSAS